MLCPTCRQAELEASRRELEHRADDGSVNRAEVDVLVCPNCAEVHLTGRTAQALANQWSVTTPGEKRQHAARLQKARRSQPEVA